MNESTNVNRRYKDSLFRMIFRRKEELLSLYKGMWLNGNWIFIQKRRLCFRPRNTLFSIMCCKKLHDYSYLVEEIRKGLRKNLPLKKAIDQAIKHCIKKRILAQFLRKHRAEVKNVILTEYNEELHFKTIREEGREKGRLEKETELANDMIKSGYSDEQICQLLKYSREQVDDLRKSLSPK